MPRLGTSALAALLVVSAAWAQDEVAWLQADGAGGFTWGTNSVPVDALPRPRDLVLPDSVFIGANKQDRPDDLEVKGPAGERRFLRYARGALVDAWWVKEGRLDPAPLTYGAKPAWTGVVLGPAEDGFLAYGVASSWTLGERTLLHWRDREGKREVLVSRATPTLQYGIGRAAPLERPGDTGSRPRVSGDFRKEVKPYVGSLAGCFDTSPKPVIAKIDLKLDRAGAPSRIRVSADQPAFNLEDCVAAALMDLRGDPGVAGSMELFRMQ
jgi:hypothetical protein